MVCETKQKLKFKLHLPWGTKHDLKASLNFSVRLTNARTKVKPMQEIISPEKLF